MSNKSRIRGPRRRITRLREATLVSFGTGVFTIAKFTATRAITLVRALYQGTIVHVNLTADFNEYEMLLDLRPRDIQVAPIAAIGNVTMNEVPVEEIWRHRGAMGDSTAAGTASTEVIFIDTKAMRKMRIDDVLELSGISDEASSFSLNGNLYLWFKEV